MGNKRINENFFKVDIFSDKIYILINNFVCGRLVPGFLSATYGNQDFFSSDKLEPCQGEECDKPSYLCPMSYT